VAVPTRALLDLEAIVGREHVLTDPEVVQVLLPTHPTERARPQGLPLVPEVPPQVEVGHEVRLRVGEAPVVGGGVLPAGGALEGEDGYACAGDGDCHLIVIHRPTRKLYEQWRANISGSTYECGCLAVRDICRAAARCPRDSRRTRGLGP
jgi:hypothetical protein